MATTALQIIQQATGELGLVVPSSVAATNTADNVQLLALLNAVGAELITVHPWNSLIKPYRFFTNYYTATNVYTVKGSPIITTVDGIQAGLTIPDNDCLQIESADQEIQIEAATDATFLNLDTSYAILGTGINKNTEVLTVNSANQLTMNQPAVETGYANLYFCKVRYPMPSDYGRPISRTHWDQSKHWEMLGPLTPQQWEWIQSGFIASGPRIRWRMAGNKFEIWPPMTDSEMLGYEYLSNAWAYGSDGASKTYITADTDTTIYPDRLLVLGVKIKYFEIKGFDASIFKRDYSVALNDAKAADSAMGTISMAPVASTLLISWSQIPDSGYGGVQ